MQAIPPLDASVPKCSTPREDKNHQMVKWSAKETILLQLLIQTHKNNWAAIAPKLGRSTASVRNRVARLGGRGSKKKSRCVRCGQVRAGHVCPLEINDTTHEEVLNEFVRVCGDDSPEPIKRSDSIDSIDAERFVDSIFANDEFVDLP